MEGMFQGIVGLDSVEFLQLSEHQSPVINKTNFSNPPLPRTAVPGDPCTSKAAGAPTYEHKRNAKCTIKKSPQCYKLQERFLLIQSGVKDERDNLLSEIEFTKEACDETSKTLQTQIQDDTNLLADAEAQLADSMTKEATAAEQGRQTARLNAQLDADLKTKMKLCNKNYIQFETELCALKKIRGELYKMKGRTVFFQDCIVAKWDPEVYGH
jgi:ATP-dependent Lon protease